MSPRRSNKFTDAEKDAFVPPTCLSCGEPMLPEWNEIATWQPTRPNEPRWILASYNCECDNPRPDRDPLEVA